MTSSIATPLRLVEATTQTTFDQVRTRYTKAITKYETVLRSSGGKRNELVHKLDALRAAYIAAESEAAAAVPSLDQFHVVNTIPAALERSGRGDAVRIVVRLKGATDPEMWPCNGRHHQGYRFELEDVAGATLTTALTFNNTLTHAALRALQSGTPLDVVGSLAVVTSGKKLVPALAVHGLRSLSSALAAVGATRAETCEAETLLERLLCGADTSNPGAILDRVIDELRWLHRVETDGLPEGFTLAERATVLQALSTGQLPNANPRLHTLVVGLPGSGKKILAGYVNTLEPVCLPAQASSMTRAGLGAGTSRGKDGLKAEAGLLPRAHLGAVVIEDLHGLRQSQREQVHSTLAQAMEDGKVGLSTMARQDFVAETALHYDLNRQSQLRADAKLAACGPRALVNDLGLRLDLLTRVDLIFELSASEKNAANCAKAMLSSRHGRDGDAGGEREERIRTLRVMIALLRERHPEVDLGPVVGEMQRQLEALLKPLDACRTPDFDPSAFSRRMANSVRKLVAAAARLCDRGAATDQDVALAVELLRPKVDFLRGLATGVPDLRDLSARQAAIRRLFADRVFSPQEVMDALGIPRRTAMRDLREIAEKVGRGRYKISGDGEQCASCTSERGKVLR